MKKIACAHHAGNDFSGKLWYNRFVFKKIDVFNKEIWKNSPNNPSEELKKAEEALKISQSSEYQLGIAESLLNLGRCNIFIAEYKKAEDYITKSIERFRMLSGVRAENGEMRALNTLGVAFFELRDYENSLNNYFMALTQAELAENNEIKVFTLNNIGDIYKILDNITEALSYAHRALKIAKKAGEKYCIAMTMNKIGSLYIRMNDLVQANQYQQEALNIAEEFDFLKLKADALSGIGKIKLIKEEFFSADEKLIKAFDIYEQIGDVSNMAECNYQFAIMGMSNKKFEDALNYINKAEETAKKLNNIELLSRCMLKRSEIAKNLENFPEALKAHEQFYKLKEELTNENLRNRLKKITILYEKEHTETEKENYRMQSIELQKTNTEIKFINEIGQIVTSSLRIDEIIYNTYDSLIEQININSFGIAFYDEESEDIEYNYIIDENARYNKIKIPKKTSNSLTMWCLNNRKPVIINKRSEANKYVKGWSGANDARAHSAIYMPMLQGAKLVGCLTIQNRKENMYSENDLDLVEAVATFLAIAVDNSRIHSELNKLNLIIMSEKKGLEVAYRKIAHMANHDSLTDLPNRHLLSELLRSGISIAAREKQKLAILYMDLNKFKPINDTLGHDSGDFVLKVVADRLESTLRSSDTVARIGGDEFVAVLHNIESREGIETATKKIIDIVGREIQLKGRMFKVGVSIGVSIFPKDGTKMDELLLKADKAMYRSKQSGGTRACFYSE